MTVAFSLRPMPPLAIDVNILKMQSKRNIAAAILLSALIVGSAYFSADFILLAVDHEDTVRRNTAVSPMEIASLVPARSLIAYMAVPYSALEEDVPVGGKRPVATIQQVIGFLKFGGLIPDEGQVFADIAVALPLLGQYEHALVVIDASSRQVKRPPDRLGGEPRTSLRLGKLEAAVILKTDSKNAPVLENLNRVVARYTNSDIAILDNLNAEGFAYQRLRDKRLPKWACCEWGLVGDYFVIGFGEESFEAIAKTQRNKQLCLAGDAWFMQAQNKISKDSALASWFIGFDPLKHRLGEISRERVDRVLAELGATNISRDLWTIGLDGKALYWSRCFEANGKDEIRKYSNPEQYFARHLNTIPLDARHYTILNLPTRWLLESVPKAWLATGAEARIEQWQKIWEGLEVETGLDLSSLLIDNLGDHILVFDYPVHPLNVPFALTIAIEIRKPEAVKSSLDAILSAWGQYLDQTAERKDSKLFRVKVQRDKDVWFLQAGILGPALIVTDRYIVVSWSPHAVRQAAKAMADADNAAANAAP